MRFVVSVKWNLLFITELTLWSDVSSLVETHALETHTQPEFGRKAWVFRLKYKNIDVSITAVPSVKIYDPGDWTGIGVLKENMNTSWK